MQNTAGKDYANDYSQTGKEQLKESYYQPANVFN